MSSSEFPRPFGEGRKPQDMIISVLSLPWIQETVTGQAPQPNESLQPLPDFKISFVGEEDRCYTISHHTNYAGDVRLKIRKTLGATDGVLEEELVLITRIRDGRPSGERLHLYPSSTPETFLEEVITRVPQLVTA